MSRPFVILSLPLMLFGCGWFGDDAPPEGLAPQLSPTVVSLTLRADDKVNLDRNGTPKPVEVAVYQLASEEKFVEADFFGLDEVIGDDLLSVERFMIAPGNTDVYQREFDEEARFFGVVAAYHDIDDMTWRAVHEVPREQTTLFNVTLDEAGVALGKPGL